MYPGSKFSLHMHIITGGAEEYQVPYAERVEHDPSLEEMKKLVSIEEYRPPLPNNWECDEV